MKNQRNFCNANFVIGNVMTRINHNLPTTLLKTDRPVVAINVLMRHYLPALEAVLRRGVTAIADPRRSGFYELDTGGNWYYIHIPSRIAGVYLIAASGMPCEGTDVSREHYGDLLVTKH